MSIENLNTTRQRKYSL